MGGAHSKHERRKVQNFVRKFEDKRKLSRCRRRCEDIRMDNKETGCGDVDWIHMTQNMGKWCTLVNMVMNLRDEEKAGTT
jgi:hypothetical protein